MKKLTLRLFYNEMLTKAILERFRFKNCFCLFFIIFPCFLFGSVLIPAKDSNYKDFESYIKNSEYLSYSQYQLIQIKTKQSQIQFTLASSENWLRLESQYLDVNKEIRSRQSENIFNGAERKLLFNTFEKKLSQTLDSQAHKYYLSQLCWIFSNDKQLKYEFNQFEKYCHYEKIYFRDLLKQFPDYTILISDGNVFNLQDDQHLKYNEVPQHLLLLSDKKQAIKFYGQVTELAKLSLDVNKYLVTGSCKDYESSKLEDIESYDIFFNPECIQNFKPKSIFSKIGTYIKSNKYEIISGLILSALIYNYFSDKTIKFE